MYVNWSIEDDAILIEFVRENEILYDVKNKNYRQTQMKQKLWSEVAEILNKTDSDCYKRWCYVRDYYIRRKGKPGTSGEGARKRSVLLSFLDSVSSSQRNSITNVPIIEFDYPGEKSQDSSEQTAFQIQDIEAIACDNERDSGTVTYNEHYCSKRDTRHDDDIKREFKGDVNISRRRKNSSHAQERINLLKQLVKRKPIAQNELDETDLFFNSMAKIVKKLPRYEQVQLRMQIGSLIGSAELRHIASDSPSNSVQRPSTSRD